VLEHEILASIVIEAVAETQVLTKKRFRLPWRSRAPTPAEIFCDLHRDHLRLPCTGGSRRAGRFKDEVPYRVGIVDLEEACGLRPGCYRIPNRNSTPR
jgi:hypothetical protein